MNADNRYIQLPCGTTALVHVDRVIPFLANLRSLEGVTIYAEEDRDFSEGLSAKEFILEAFPMLVNDAKVRSYFFDKFLPFFGHPLIEFGRDDEGLFTLSLDGTALTTFHESPGDFVDAGHCLRWLQFIAHNLTQSIARRIAHRN